jgi:hypothetical protein
MKSLIDLKNTLNLNAPRFRTGLLLQERVNREELDAAAMRLQAFVIDYHQVVSSRLSTEAQVVPLDTPGILNDLRTIANSEGNAPIGLIINLDLALAKLSPAEIALFWDGYSQLQPFAQTAVVVVIPTAATSVQPIGQAFIDWKAWGRVAINVPTSQTADEEKI